MTRGTFTNGGASPSKTLSSVRSYMSKKSPLFPAAARRAPRMSICRTCSARDFSDRVKKVLPKTGYAALQVMV